jgi:hypothetical protein
MSRRVDVDGEVDAGFTSYWPPDGDGQTVGGTTDDNKGEVTTDNWPEAAPPRDDLNEDQIAVIEAAADPAREWDSLAQLSREVVPHNIERYASKTLRRKWPAGREAALSGGRGDTTKNKEPMAASWVQEIRQRLLDGETTSALADEHSCSESHIRDVAKGMRDNIPESDVNLPPLKSSGRGGHTRYVVPDESGGDGETDETQAELPDTDADADSVERREPHTPRGDTDDSRLRTAVVAVLAFVFGWVVGR